MSARYGGAQRPPGRLLGHRELRRAARQVRHQRVRQGAGPGVLPRLQRGPVHRGVRRDQVHGAAAADQHHPRGPRQGAGRHRARPRQQEERRGREAEAADAAVRGHPPQQRGGAHRAHLRGPRLRGGPGGLQAADAAVRDPPPHQQLPGRPAAGRQRALQLPGRA